MRRHLLDPADARCIAVLDHSTRTLRIPVSPSPVGCAVVQVAQCRGVAGSSLRSPSRSSGWLPNSWSKRSPLTSTHPHDRPCASCCTQSVTPARTSSRTPLMPCQARATPLLPVVAPRGHRRPVLPPATPTLARRVCAGSPIAAGQVGVGFRTKTVSAPSMQAAVFWAQKHGTFRRRLRPPGLWHRTTLAGEVRRFSGGVYGGRAVTVSLSVPLLLTRSTLR